VGVLCISCLAHISLAIGLNDVAMSLSVVASVHCCTTIAGICAPRSTLISHSPGLRFGISNGSAVAECTKAVRSKIENVALVPAMQFFFRAIVGISCLCLAGQVSHAQRAAKVPWPHPDAREENIAAVTRVRADELHAFAVARAMIDGERPD